MLHPFENGGLHSPGVAIESLAINQDYAEHWQPVPAGSSGVSPNSESRLDRDHPRPDPTLPHVRERTVTQDDLQTAVAELLVDREKVALCLDFDGTLAPIVQDPDDAALSEEIRRHLNALASSTDVDVVVISGRALSDIRSRVDVGGIKYAGNHGFQQRESDDEWVHPDIEGYRPVLERARGGLERELDPVTGCFVEDKYATLTVHHRQASSDEGSFVIATVQSLVEDEEDLTMVVDEQSVEVRPDIDHDKGDAVEELLDVGAETLVIYFGDAQTDVDAFRTLAAWDDETVHVSVGSKLPASGYHLESPTDVGQFLGWLRTELGDSDA